MEHRLLELGVHLWGEVLVLWMEVLGLVLEVMQRLQRVLQCLVLELMVVLVVVLMMMLEMIMVVLIHDLLVHIMSELFGLVFEELLELLGGLLVRDKPVLQRERERGVGHTQQWGVNTDQPLTAQESGWRRRLPASGQS